MNFLHVIQILCLQFESCSLHNFQIQNGRSGLVLFSQLGDSVVLSFCIHIASATWRSRAALRFGAGSTILNEAVTVHLSLSIGMVDWNKPTAVFSRTLQSSTAPFVVTRKYPSVLNCLCSWYNVVTYERMADNFARRQDSHLSSGRPYLLVIMDNTCHALLSCILTDSIKIRLCIAYSCRESCSLRVYCIIISAPR
jgi:hypothetical protein